MLGLMLLGLVLAAVLVWPRRDQVRLALCRPDCRGLCPTCGVDRNRLECACRTEEPDPRLAPLLEIRRKLGRDGPGKG